MLRKSSIVLLLIAMLSCRSTKPVLVAGENIAVTRAVASDSITWYYLNPWRDSVMKSMQEIVGVSDTAYFPGLPGGNLNNLVADMVMSYATAWMVDSFGFPPHACILNRGGLRNTLPKGNITSRDIFEMMPFENELVLLKIRGSAMDSALRRIAAIGGAAVAVVSMEMGGAVFKNAEISGLRFDSRREYWIATSDYVANGGDGFEVFRSAIIRIDTRKKLRDLVTAGIQKEIKSMGRLLYHDDVRIVNTKTN